MEDQTNVLNKFKESYKGADPETRSLGADSSFCDSGRLSADYPLSALVSSHVKKKRGNNTSWVI